MNKNIEIYTDGSSLGNPGPGGWGVVIVITNDKPARRQGGLRITNLKPEIIELGGGEKNTTNNRMELTGAIEALKYVSKSDFAMSIIHTDSTYVLEGVTSWVENWEKNGWKTANKKPVLNQKLWKELISLVKEFKGKIIWRKVKGHSGHVHNDRADEIATSRALLQK